MSVEKSSALDGCSAKASSGFVLIYIKPNFGYRTGLSPPPNGDQSSFCRISSNLWSSIRLIHKDMLSISIFEVSYFTQVKSFWFSQVAKLAAQNRRSMDQIASRCYYYHTLSHEAVGRLDKIRDFLHGRLRTATLSVSAGTEKTSNGSSFIMTSSFHALFA